MRKIEIPVLKVTKQAHVLVEEWYEQVATEDDKEFLLKKLEITGRCVFCGNPLKKTLTGTADDPHWEYSCPLTGFVWKED